jgi:predicted RNA-binding Zn-ribbon protein involved in translation (DUF1610 family)
MIARPTALIGSFLLLALGLVLGAIPGAKSEFWFSEIDGTSMTPTLWGERIAFPCGKCGEQLCFDRKTSNEQPLLTCDQCGAIQIAPKTSIFIRPDRVLVGPVPKLSPITPGTLVVINHLKFGATIKRVSSYDNGRYFVLGDNQETSVDSRNADFGLIPSNLIRGIVVKILPSIPASSAKAK